MKTRLQAARVTRGFKQSYVIKELVRRAEMAGLSIASSGSLQILLSNFENGKRRVNEPYRTLFRAIYGMTDEELFSSLDFADSEPTRHDEYSALAERINATRRIDKSTASLLAEQTNYLRSMDCRLDAVALADQMAGHLATIEGALSHAILPSIRRPLAAVLSDTAALAAWQALDVGAVSRSWKYHETARYAALEAQDPVLLTHAMAQQAFVLVDVGETSSAAELVDEAVREAGTEAPERFRSWLLAAQAEVSAANGDAVASQSGFDKASALLPPGQALTDPAYPFIFLNTAFLARWRGNALAKLGDPSAICALEAALDGESTISPRAAASLHCDLAQAHLMHGDPAQAKEHVLRGRRLAKEAGSVRQRQRLQRLALLS